MVLHNPNNWHWVDKNCLPWAKQYFSEKLLVKAEDGNTSVEVTKLNDVDGDCDVCQRKGKVIAIYDMHLELSFEGKTGDEEVTGRIKVPEIMYNTEEDEFQFTISIDNDTSSKDPVKALVRAKIVPQLRKQFIKFSNDVIEANGKDIQHQDQSGAQQTQKLGSVERKESSNNGLYSTTTVTLKPVFTASAQQLFQAFTDPNMVAAWTRSSPKLDARKGGEFSLFGGNVSGTFKQVEPTKIVQSWRLKDWKQGHFATLTLDLNQETNTTTLNVKWEGIPVGQEEVVENNFQNYYVRPIMLTFGYGIPS